MKTPKAIIIFLFISQFCFRLNAQQNNSADSIPADSSQRLTEALIIQQKGQEKIDSSIAMQLQNELRQASNDSKKKQQLEGKLREISERDSVRKAEQLQKINALKRTAKGYPVLLLSDTLFNIYTRVGPFSAGDRANAISERIKKLYDDPFFKPDSLKTVQNEFTYDIVYSDRPVMSVTDFDALWFNKVPADLASEYLNIIKRAVVEEKQNNSLINWLKRIGYACLIILGMGIIIYGLNRLFNYISKALDKQRATYFTGISFQNVKLLTPAQHYLFAKRINNLLRIIIIIITLYLALLLSFSMFPQTKPFGDTLLEWIIDPTKSIFFSVIKFLPNFFTIIVIYIITSYLLKLIKYFTAEVAKGRITIKGFYRDWAWPTFSIARFLIYAFMFVIIFPYLPGSNSPAFRGVTVFLGLLISLGSSSAIANVIAGLVITYMRPFKIGDRVKIGEVTGDIIEKTILVTRIRTVKNEDITVPNSSVLNNYTVNYSANADTVGLILYTSVTIGYAVPWKEMHQALIDAALKTEFVLKEPLPFVLQTSLDDFFVTYQINAYIKEANKQVDIYSDLHRNIQDVCNERGIEIMSPHYNAMRDGNQTAIPQDYLSPDYKAPSFNINVNEKKDK
jgi:small-conductance mechanosensitive channel